MNEKKSDRVAAHDAAARTTCAELLQQLRELRQEHMLSLREVASLVGLTSHSGLGDIERGVKIPRLDTFLRLLSVFGCTVRIVHKDTEKGNQPRE